jgi:hypothetical protein
MFKRDQQPRAVDRTTVPSYTMNSSSDGPSNDNAAMVPQESLDRLFISAPQLPPRLPGPPTFAPGITSTFQDHPHHQHQQQHSSSRRNNNHVHFRDARVVSLIEPGSSMTMEERNELWYPTADLDDFKVQARTLSRKLREPAIAAIMAEQQLQQQIQEQQQQLQQQEQLQQQLSPEKCSASFPPACTENRPIRRGEGSVSPPPPPLPIDSSECAAAGPPVVAEEGEGSCDGADPRGLEHRVCLNRQKNKYLAIRCTLKAQSRSRCPEFIARISSKCTSWAKELAVAEAHRDYCEAYCPQLLAGNPKILQNACPFSVPVRQIKRCHGGDDSQAEALLGGGQPNEACLQSFASPAQLASPLVAASSSPAAACSPPPKCLQDEMVAAEQQAEQQAVCFMERCVRQKRDGDVHC